MSRATTFHSFSSSSVHLPFSSLLFSSLFMNPLVTRRLLRDLLRHVAIPSSKAFIFAYIYVVLPKLFHHIGTAWKKRDGNLGVDRMVKTMRTAMHPHKFPAFAACLVGYMRMMEVIMGRALGRGRGPRAEFTSTLVLTMVAAAAAFPRFQNHVLGHSRFASLDITLLVFSRAIDTAVSATAGRWVPGGVLAGGDAMLFIASCSFIMFCWFFYPHRLPPAYRKWITSAANMDPEMITILSNLHHGEARYGSRTTVLDPYCDRHHQPRSRGDLAQSIPLECETVHAFYSPNCEKHAAWRFARGFKFGAKVYGTINAVVAVIVAVTKGKGLTGKRTWTSVLRALALQIGPRAASTARSSCFLGAFIGLYWYAVCLARTRALPRLFPLVPKTRWDTTIGPTMGAIVCGFSSLIEKSQRRKELALFVFPKAIGTVVPPEATSKNLAVEQGVFAVSMAVLVAYCKQDPKLVRGVFGRGLKLVI